MSFHPTPTFFSTVSSQRWLQGIGDEFLRPSICFSAPLTVPGCPSCSPTPALPQGMCCFSPAGAHLQLPLGSAGGKAPPTPPPAPPPLPTQQAGKEPSWWAALCWEAGGQGSLLGFMEVSERKRWSPRPVMPVGQLTQQRVRHHLLSTYRTVLCCMPSASSLHPGMSLTGYKWAVKFTMQ